MDLTSSPREVLRLLLLGLLTSFVSCEDCDGLLKAVLQHNSPEFVGIVGGSHMPAGGSQDKDLLFLSFTWDHIHSLIKDCAAFYLLERRPISYGKISKRESSYHTSSISEPLKNGSGSFGLSGGDCKVYSVQLTVSSALDGSLYYSMPARIWPKGYAEARVTENSDSFVRLSWPPSCGLPRAWRLLAISSSADPVRSKSSGYLGGLSPCTPYEIVLEDAEESPIWSIRLHTKPSPPKILVIPGHRTMTVTTTTGKCSSSSSEFTTEITYCSSHDVSDAEGSGGFFDGEEEPEETCLTRTLSESGSPRRILLKNLSPCTIYSLRFRTVDMSADMAENTVLQEYDAAHSTLCMRTKERNLMSPVEEESTSLTASSSAPASSDAFWFDVSTTTTTEEARNVEDRRNAHHLSPEIHKPDIRRTRPATHLGLDVTIGISLGLSCLFILIGATVIASVFHLVYNNKTSAKFSKIAHLECAEDEEDEDNNLNLHYP